jgi:hypothetical protein
MTSEERMTGEVGVRREHLEGGAVLARGQGRPAETGSEEPLDALALCSLDEPERFNGFEPRCPGLGVSADEQRRAAKKSRGMKVVGRPVVVLSGTPAEGAGGAEDDGPVGEVEGEVAGPAVVGGDDERVVVGINGGGWAWVRSGGESLSRHGAEGIYSGGEGWPLSEASDGDDGAEARKACEEVGAEHEEAAEHADA